MRRILSIAIIVCAAGGVLFARGGASSRPQTPPQVSQSAQTARSGAPKEQAKVIDLKADLTGPIAPGDTVMFLVGNFAAQHNGAVITCDSAVRYSANRIEFFGNVLINKNTTYIYGERADYNGLLNEARVYSDIVKVIDGDATLYTYEFVFNTQSNVGIFGGGGVLLNRDNLVEADHGFYYADTKELVCVDEVQMRNDEYQMKGDSVIYNLESDHAYYFEHTNIWSVDGDYLYADRGEYEKTDTLYKVTRNGYILTEKQELWGDSINYFRAKEHAILRRDIQIDDTEHKTLAFGDYGEYWKYPGNALLTLRPSMVNYDPEQGDSLFMRADSMFLYTIFTRVAEAEAAARKADSLAATKQQPDASDADTTSKTKPVSGEETPPRTSDHASETGSTTLSPPSLATDSLPHSPADSLAKKPASKGKQPTASESADSTSTEKSAEPKLTAKERKAKLREAALKDKAERKAAAEAIRDATLDSIADKRQAKITATLLAQKAHEERALAVRKEKALVRLRKHQAKAIRKGRELPDSSMLTTLDSLLAGNAVEQDSLASMLADTLPADSLSQVIAADSVDSLDTLNRADTMYRLIKAYRNVRSYRTDFQSVCDSLTAISRDSTIHLYIDPILWNQENQITSDVMDIFIKNQQIVRAEFIGQPMMVSQLDTMHYNQVAGKEMTAFFNNNKIFRNDVNGSAQTIYYIQEDGLPEVKGMMVMDSGNISFYIDENNKIQTITYRIDPTWTTYPMSKIPPEQDPYLKNFKWQAARRPTRDDVFDRTIRPSEREARSRLPYPDFPIAERLDRDRKRFGESGWADRDDVVTPEIDEWMRSLGFPTGQPRR